MDGGHLNEHTTSEALNISIKSFEWDWNESKIKYIIESFSYFLKLLFNGFSTLNSSSIHDFLYG